jgi:exodeoxyribonuclease VII small subunit
MEKIMANKFDFNKGLSELESIISKMESGDLSLEDSLKYFEKGVKLHRQCHTALSDAEQRISVLSESDDYSSEKPFDGLE